jgi:hypothetical protein
MADERLKALLALSEAELWRPLWDWPPEARNDVLRARVRRQWAQRDPDSEWTTPEALTPVLDFAETE